MTFEDTVESIRVPLREGRFPNEAAIANGVILPILQGLDWPVFNPSVVVPQYPGESLTQHSAGSKTWVDFALCNSTDFQSLVFVEIQKAGFRPNRQEDDKSLAQLMQYAFKNGVGIAVLTDGREWGFYLPAAANSYAECQVYKLDLLEQDIAECCSRLRRYLARNDVEQGIALSNAQSDHKIKETLPTAWRILLEDADAALIESLSAKVEALCGFKPAPEACAEFLSAISRGADGQPAESPPPVRRQEPSGFGFALHGQWYPGGTVSDVMRTAFEKLTAADPSFMEKFAAKKHGRKRRYIARRQEDLYPGRPDLCENFSIRLPSGWFMGTNYSKSTLPTFGRLACESAGLEYGRDFVLQLG